MHWHTELQRFERSLQRGQAKLRVSSAGMGRIDRLGTAAVEALMAAPAGDDGWREASVPIEGIGQAATLLIGFGSDVEVLSPPELRAELARRATDVLALYI